jgi:hypothetical protein
VHGRGTALNLSAKSPATREGVLFLYSAGPRPLAPCLGQDWTMDRNTGTTSAKGTRRRIDLCGSYAARTNTCLFTGKK